MEFTGEHRLPVAQQQVWEALNDPAILKASIAGCQQLERLSDTSFAAVVTAKVGPISATFRGSVELSELKPPHSYTLTGQGQGGAAGFAKMRARVALEPEGDKTLLRYTAEAEIGGKFASVGSRLLQTVVKKNAEDFFAAFAQQLTGGPAASEASLAAVKAAGETLREAGVNAARPAPLTGASSWTAPVPAWLVVFAAGLGAGLGLCLGLLLR
jgi:carbon monoxide dehydrogenase subunit G